MPLLCINTIIENTKEAILFSKFNLYKGYYNVRNSKQSEDILAFKITQGLYAPIVMPFGPTNYPAVMQRFMNHVFKPLYNKYGPQFKNYIDNCGIFMLEGELELY